MVFIGSYGRQVASVLLAGLLACLSSAAGAQSRGSLDTRYTITAALDPIAHRVRGRVRIDLRNQGPPLREIWLQLYANARRDARAIFQQGLPLRETQRGRVELRSLRARGTERLHAAHMEQLPGDFTQCRLPLDEPVATGEALDLEIDFETQLPELASRTGHAEDFHLVAQWFPKLARRRPNGRWNPHPFAALTEFRSDYAHYAVTLDVPQGFLIEGPGVRSQTRGGTRFVVGPATDFAWAACQHCERTAQQHGKIQVRLLRADGTRAAADRQLEVILAGLDYFSAQLAPYPYDQLSVVVPPRDAPVQGMEYPGLVVTPAGPSWVRSVPWLDGRHVAAHELAHQWFYGLVSSDEVSRPVLDEGLTEWAANDLLAHLDGERMRKWWQVESFEGLRLAAAVAGPPPPPAGRPGYSYALTSYARAVYARAALALESLRRAHGDRRFRRALRSYVKAARFSHGDPTALARAFDASYGPGFFERQVAPLLLRGDASDVHLDTVKTRSADGGYATRILAHRSGHGALPTWVALLDADARELTRIPWPARHRAIEVTAHTNAPVHRVQLDPDRALLLDENRFDHVWQQVPTDTGPWMARLFAWAQTLWTSLGP